MSNYEIVVIGAGAAGMMAAIAAAQNGARVLVLERNEKPGKKIYITGKGRCNLTNDCDRETLMRSIVRNGRFMYSALSAFDNHDLMALIEENGVQLKTERGGRVFPVSDHASDITRALRRAMDSLGADIRVGARVQGLMGQEGAMCGVRLESGEEIPAKAVILATGGLTYPSTGSTGDGHDLARAWQHGVTKCHPSLAPIETQEAWPADLQGLALKNVRLTLTRDGKRQFSDIGELMFTHFGVGGPLVLTASAHISGQEMQRWEMALDMKPGLDAAQLEERLMRDFLQNHNRHIVNVLPALLPSRMGPLVLGLAGIAPETTCNQVTREQRRALVETVKALVLHPVSTRGWNEAVVTRGGVDVADIDPSSMASRKTPGLYFAGELIDVDGLTGGFNLQIAFSTGYLAGRSAAWALPG